MITLQIVCKITKKSDTKKGGYSCEQPPIFFQKKSTYLIFSANSAPALNLATFLASILIGFLVNGLMP